MDADLMFNKVNEWENTTITTNFGHHLASCRQLTKQLQIVKTVQIQNHLGINKIIL